MNRKVFHLKEGDPLLNDGRSPSDRLSGAPIIETQLSAWDYASKRLSVGPSAWTSVGAPERWSERLSVGQSA